MDPQVANRNMLHTNRDLHEARILPKVGAAAAGWRRRHSLGFADPETGIAFGYVMNRMQ
jgi:hypothetical protein